MPALLPPNRSTEVEPSAPFLGSDSGRGVNRRSGAWRPRSRARSGPGRVEHCVEPLGERVGVGQLVHHVPHAGERCPAIRSATSSVARPSRSFRCLISEQCRRPRRLGRVRAPTDQASLSSAESSRPTTLGFWSSGCLQVAAAQLRSAVFAASNCSRLRSPAVIRSRMMSRAVCRARGCSKYSACSCETRKRRHIRPSSGLPADPHAEWSDRGRLLVIWALATLRRGSAT